jgi:hypothetical protein
MLRNEVVGVRRLRVSGPSPLSGEPVSCVTQGTVFTALLSSSAMRGWTGPLKLFRLPLATTLTSCGTVTFTSAASRGSIWSSHAAFQSLRVDTRVRRSRRSTVFIRVSIPVEINAW